MEEACGNYIATTIGSVKVGTYTSRQCFPCSLWLPWVKSSTFSGVDLPLPSSVSSHVCQQPQLRLQLQWNSLILEICIATGLVTTFIRFLREMWVILDPVSSALVAFQSSSQRKVKIQFLLQLNCNDSILGRVLLELLYKTFLQISNRIIFSILSGGCC